jgi:hypothetical protein
LGSSNVRAKRHQEGPRCCGPQAGHYPSRNVEDKHSISMVCTRTLLKAALRFTKEMTAIFIATIARQRR